MYICKIVNIVVVTKAAPNEISKSDFYLFSTYFLFTKHK